MALETRINLDRALQINTAALAIMGAVFLGLGHESVFLPLALAAAAVGSATLTNLFRWLRLNRIIANLVALAAVAWSLRNFLQIGSQDQLLAIADMLVYLQIVLLFQEKTGRVYWQLIVLSLLQVVVAAALNMGPQFGALLAVYMALALSALVLLCLHREWRGPAGPASAVPASAVPASVAGVPAGAIPGWQSLLGPPLVLAPAIRDDVASVARPPLIARQVALLGAATLVFAAVFFYATPRLGEGSWAGSRSGTHAVTGLHHEAQLEEYGRIHQSNQLVMRVALTGVVQREPYLMIGDPYFNGMALGEYVHDGTSGRWTTHRFPPGSNRLMKDHQAKVSAAAAMSSSHQVRQDYKLEGNSSGVLFVIVPMHRVDGTPHEFFFSPLSQRLWQQSDNHAQLRDFRYSAATTSLRNGRQLRGVPHVNPLLSERDRLILQQEMQAMLQFNEQRFGALAALAAQIIRDEQLEAAGPLERALALERHFFEGARYKYSLSLDFVRNRQLDPIEDFVANHRTGHCEYFASALVMMLRSQGIPARMIVGYKGGDYNSLGSYYQVRQKHAHAWVEALLPDGAVPDWEIAGGRTPAGVWYRFDPTPSAAMAAGAGGEDGLLDRVGEAFDYVELLWRDYVLSLNATKQQDTIYEPVSARALDAVPTWMESRALHRLVRRMARKLGINFEIDAQRNRVERVFDWRMGVLVVTLVLLAVISLQAIVLLVQLVRGWGRRSAGALAKGGKRPPRFYLRLESLLGRMHLRRSAGQTPRELAAAAAARLYERPAEPVARLREQPEGQVAQIPDQIVAAYYRVRFGGATLDSHEQAAIEHALAQLTPAVNQARP